MNDPAVEITKRIADASEDLERLRRELQRIIDAADSANQHATTLEGATNHAVDLIRAVEQTNAGLVDATDAARQALGDARSGLSLLAAQAEGYEPARVITALGERIEAGMADVTKTAREEIVSATRPLAELTQQLEAVGARLRDQDPSRLYGKIDSFTEELDNFRVGLDPLRTQTEKIVSTLSRRGGIMDIAGKVQGLQRWVVVNSVITVALCILVIAKVA